MRLSPSLLPDDSLEKFCVRPQFTVLGASQMTNSTSIVTTTCRSFKASWSKSLPSILNELKALSSSDKGQWVDETLLRRGLGETS